MSIVFPLRVGFGHLHAISDDPGACPRGHVANEVPREPLASLVAFIPAGYGKESSRDEARLADSAGIAA